MREAAGSVRPGRWLRGRGWRSGDWSPPVEPTRQALDEVDRRHADRAHGARLPLALAQLGRARRRPTATSRSTGGVVERRRRAASRPASCARSPPGTSATATCSHRRRVRRRDARGLQLAASRGVTAVHDKDGWLGAPRLWQRLADEGALTLRVWQSLPYDYVGRLEEIGLRAGLGDDLLRIGYLKVFMDGTLGSQTARLLDGSGVEITSREELAEIIRAGARGGWPVAVHAIGDLANREALDAFEETRDEWAPLGLRPADRARAAPRRGGHPAVRRARRRRLRPVQPRALGSGHRRPELGRDDRPRLRLPVAARLGRRRRERLRRADRGARPAGRDPRRSAAHARRSRRLAPGAGGHGRAGARSDDPRAGLARTRRAHAAASSSPATSPTSSSSTATRSRSSRRSYPKSRSSRRWSAAAGRTTRHPGTRP